MTRILPVRLLALAIPSAVLAAPLVAPPPPLSGSWSGALRYGGESKAFGVRFATNEKNVDVMFFDLPDLKFKNVGPIPLKRDGDVYAGAGMSLRPSPDGHRISGSWAFDGHELAFDLEPTPLAPAPVSTPEGRIAEPRWKLKTGGPIWSSPAVADGTIYFGSGDGRITAAAARDGRVEWRFATGGPVMGPVSLDGRHLYALSDDGFLYKLERRSGRRVWRFDTRGGAVLRDPPGTQTPTYDSYASAATVADGVVYVGSADKRLYAIDAASGRERWHVDTGGIIRSTPAVAGGRVFFGSRDHHVYALDARTGALAWKVDTLREVVSAPLVAQGTVYVGSRSSDLFALDAASGAVRWKFFYWSSWVESSARIRDGVLYIGSSDSQQLFAIDAATGRRVWSFCTDGSDWGTPAVTESRVYIGAVGVPHYLVDHRGGFFAVDRATGRNVWRFPMRPADDSGLWGVASSPAVTDGMVYFGGLDGVFYAFAAEE